MNSIFMKLYVTWLTWPKCDRTCWICYLCLFFFRWKCTSVACCLWEIYILHMKNINLFHLWLLNFMNFFLQKWMFHSLQWLCKMMKVILGKSLLNYTARKKNSGRLLYRNGIDLLNSFQLVVVNYHTVDIKQTETNILYGKMLLSFQKRIGKCRGMKYLLKQLKFCDQCNKTYVPNIHNCASMFELKLVPPFYGILLTDWVPQTRRRRNGRRQLTAGITITLKTLSTLSDCLLDNIFLVVFLTHTTPNVYNLCIC